MLVAGASRHALSRSPARAEEGNGQHACGFTDRLALHIVFDDSETLVGRDAAVNWDGIPRQWLEESFSELGYLLREGDSAFVYTLLRAHGEIVRPVVRWSPVDEADLDRSVEDFATQVTDSIRRDTLAAFSDFVETVRQLTLGLRSPRSGECPPVVVLITDGSYSPLPNSSGQPSLRTAMQGLAEAAARWTSADAPLHLLVAEVVRGNEAADVRGIDPDFARTILQRRERFSSTDRLRSGHDLLARHFPGRVRKFSHEGFWRNLLYGRNASVGSDVMGFRFDGWTSIRQGTKLGLVMFESDRSPLPANATFNCTRGWKPALEGQEIDVGCLVVLQDPPPGAMRDVGYDAAYVPDSRILVDHVPQNVRSVLDLTIGIREDLDAPQTSCTAALVVDRVHDFKPEREAPAVRLDLLDANSEVVETATLYRVGGLPCYMVSDALSERWVGRFQAEEAYELRYQIPDGTGNPDRNRTDVRISPPDFLEVKATQFRAGVFGPERRVSATIRRRKRDADGNHRTDSLAARIGSLTIRFRDDPSRCFPLPATDQCLVLDTVVPGPLGAIILGDAVDRQGLDPTTILQVPLDRPLLPSDFRWLPVALTTLVVGVSTTLAARNRRRSGQVDTAAPSIPVAMPRLSRLAREAAFYAPMLGLSIVFLIALGCAISQGFAPEAVEVILTIIATFLVASVLSTRERLHRGEGL